MILVERPEAQTKLFFAWKQCCVRFFLVALVFALAFAHSSTATAQGYDWQPQPIKRNNNVLNLNAAIKPRFDPDIMRAREHGVGDFVSVTNWNAIQAALDLYKPPMFAAEMAEVQRPIAKRAWVAVSGTLPYMPIENVGAFVMNAEEGARIGCPRDLVEFDCVARLHAFGGQEDSNPVVAESFFFEGLWDQEDCWLAQPCDAPNIDGTYGPFPAIALQFEDNLFLYGRCNDERQIYMICGGTPAGVNNWNPCNPSNRFVATKVYLTTDNYFKSYQDFGLNAGRIEENPIALDKYYYGWFDENPIALDNYYLEQLLTHGLFGYEDQIEVPYIEKANRLAADFSAFDCGPNNPVVAALKTAESISPPQQLKKVVAETDDEARCADASPDEVCEGEKAGKPSGCVYADKSQCEANGLARGFNGLRLGENEGDDEQNKAPEFPYVVALINAGDEVLCSGSIVNDQLVLTASHCKCKHGDQIRAVFVGNKIGTTEEERSEYGGHVFPVSDGSLHDKDLHFEPNFCEADDMERDSMPDIALLEFQNNEPLSEDYILKIAPNFDQQDFYQAIITGFGTSEEQAKGGTKRFAHGIPISTCDPDNNSAHQESGCHPEVDLVSVNDHSRKDACAGDSGGPAFSLRGVLIAVIRGGINPAEGQEATDCGYGGLYSKMSRDTYSSRDEELYEWLNEKIKSH